MGIFDDMQFWFKKISDQERINKLSVPKGKIRLIMDTDAKNEIDDQFAIAWALRSVDRFEVEAVYAAPFSHDCLKSMLINKKIEHAQDITYTEEPKVGMKESYKEICKLYNLLGISHAGKVYEGSAKYIVDIGKAVESEAAGDLVERAKKSDETLYIAAFGAVTNIASAILLEPEIIKKIVVIWLGGQPLWFGHGIEFNLMQDITAAQIIFNSGVPLVYIPCMNVASLLLITEDEVRAKLLGINAISDYLAQNVLDAFGDTRKADFTAAMYRNSYLKDREDQSEEYLKQFESHNVAWSRVIWDIATIAFLKNPVWTPSTLVPAPVLQDDMSYGKISAGRHKIRTVNYCHRDLIFGDLFNVLTNGERG